NASIVDEDVAAPTVVLDFFPELGDVCRIADVALDGDSAAASSLDRLQRVVGLGAIGDHDLRTLLHQAHRRRLPDARRGARNDGGFALVSLAHSSKSPVFSARSFRTDQVRR